MMASKLTEHVAVNAPDGWRVSWMPLRALTRTQCVSAMLIVENAAAEHGSPLWAHVKDWVGELDPTGAEAAEMARAGAAREAPP